MFGQIDTIRMARDLAAHAGARQQAVARNVAHPALGPLAEALADVPPPSPEVIDGIRARCGTVTE